MWSSLSAGDFQAYKRGADSLKNVLNITILRLGIGNIILSDQHFKCPLWQSNKKILVPFEKIRFWPISKYKFSIVCR